MKYKAALSVTYGAGLRVSEVVNLKPDDIDSDRTIIRVEQGKGRNGRHVKGRDYAVNPIFSVWGAASSMRCSSASQIVCIAGRRASSDGRE